MRVGIIGAGTSGLCAAHHLMEEDDMQVVVYERNAELGGTWIYTEEIGLDEYGLPVHSSMYKSLRTNLPKETMGFPDFPMPNNPKSYVPANEVLNFLNVYADEFGLREFIKFSHYVELVKPTEDEKWAITVKDLKNQKTTTEIFDALMVCNGHYHEPKTPELPNKELYQGLQIHSHDYRTPDPYTNANVLVIGGGPSGIDLALEISTVAKHVTLSHHRKRMPQTTFPSNFVMRVCDVRELTPTGAIFEDGHEQDYDIILYCTGYLFTFPFLSPECGITVRDNFVQPLYKHLVNIKRPTMAIVGIPFQVCAAQMIDLQVRFFVKALSGKFKLPSKEEMQKDTDRDMQDRWSRGHLLRQAHMMGPDQKKYYTDLAETADIYPILPVITNIHNDIRQRFLAELNKFREYVYEVLDDENFKCMYKND